MQYIIANFKSHKTQREVKAWLDEFKNPSPQAQVIVALPMPYLHLLSQPGLSLGAQNVSSFPAGSYTGEVNAAQLSDQGVKYCIIGHSERRKYLHETSVEVGRKATELLNTGITPIICVSEADLSSQFAALDDDVISRSLFAYESLEDIGGQETTPIEHIQEVLRLLKQYTKDSSLGLLYGGSVNETNVSSLVGVVDGLLVATASLNPSEFAAVVTGFTRNG